MQSIIPNLVAITPYQMYLQRVNALYDNTRQTRAGLTYTPAQFGGLFGQWLVAQESLVLEVTNFNVQQ